MIAFLISAMIAFFGCPVGVPMALGLMRTFGVWTTVEERRCKAGLVPVELDGQRVHVHGEVPRPVAVPHRPAVPSSGLQNAGAQHVAILLGTEHPHRTFGSGKGTRGAALPTGEQRAISAEDAAALPTPRV